MQTTLGEFLRNCNKVAWMIEAKNEQGHVVVSGLETVPIIGSSVYLSGMVASSELVGEIGIANRVVGSLVDGTLIEDVATFAIGTATLMVWRTMKKES